MLINIMYLIKEKEMELRTKERTQYFPHLCSITLLFIYLLLYISLLFLIGAQFFAKYSISFWKDSSHKVSHMPTKYIDTASDRPDENDNSNHISAAALKLISTRVAGTLYDR